jgi:hypothetical protein
MSLTLDGVRLVRRNTVGVRPGQHMALLSRIHQARPELTFFKVLGPERTVEAAKTEFLHLVESIRPK